MSQLPFLTPQNKTLNDKIVFTAAISLQAFMFLLWCWVMNGNAEGL